MTTDPSDHVTQLLNQADGGDAAATDALLPLVYDELRRLAAARLGNLPPGQTLQPTALVHDAYVKLVGGNAGAWTSRRHFFMAAARAMRNLLVDDARRKDRVKHGGDLRRVSITALDADYEQNVVDQLALDEALTTLEARDATKAEIVHLRYFAGLTIDQTAQALDVAPATVDLHWKYARAWLSRELSGA